MALADSIRDELKQKGILIKDTRDGTTLWNIIKVTIYKNQEVSPLVFIQFNYIPKLFVFIPILVLVALPGHWVSWSVVCW